MAGQGSGVPAVRVHRSVDGAAVRVGRGWRVAGVMGSGMCGWSCPLEWTGGATGSGGVVSRRGRRRWRCWQGSVPEGRRDGRGGDGGGLAGALAGLAQSPAASTVRGYDAHVRLYLAPYLGEVLLAELTTGQVQAMFTAIIRQHQALGTPVSAATLTRHRAPSVRPERGHCRG